MVTARKDQTIQTFALKYWIRRQQKKNWKLLIGFRHTKKINVGPCLKTLLT